MTDIDDPKYYEQVDRLLYWAKMVTKGRPWTRISDMLPPDDIEVDTKVDDEKGVRNEQSMTLRSSLWWISENMYVYYSPTHWRPME